VKADASGVRRREADLSDQMGVEPEVAAGSVALSANIAPDFANALGRPWCI
jgi:hypothetical protein